MIEQYSDHQITLFPFEKKYFSKVLFFGNPLIDELAQCPQEEKEEHKTKNFITFMPGSRKQEIRALLPIFKPLAKKINNETTYKAQIVILRLLKRRIFNHSMAI